MTLWFLSLSVPHTIKFSVRNNSIPGSFPNKRTEGGASRLGLVTFYIALAREYTLESAGKASAAPAASVVPTCRQERQLEAMCRTRIDSNCEEYVWRQAGCTAPYVGGVFSGYRSASTPSGQYDALVAEAVTLAADVQTKVAPSRHHAKGVIT